MSSNFFLENKCKNSLKNIHKNGIFTLKVYIIHHLKKKKRGAKNEERRI